MRDKAVHFCTALIAQSSAHSAACIEELWADDKNLRNLFHELFAPPFELRPLWQPTLGRLLISSDIEKETSAAPGHSDEPPAKKKTHFITASSSVCRIAFSCAARRRRKASQKNSAPHHHHLQHQPHPRVQRRPTTKNAQQSGND